MQMLLYRNFSSVLMCILLSFLSNTAEAQNSKCECEGIRKREVFFFQAVLTGNRDKMVALYDTVRAMNSPLCKAYALNFQAQLAFFDGKKDSAYALLTSERKLLDELQCGNKTYIFNERQLGYFAFVLSDLEESVSHQLKVADICGANNDTAQQVTALMNVTTVVTMLGDYKRALEILDKVRILVNPEAHRDYYGNITDAYVNMYRLQYDKTKDENAKQKYFEWTATSLEYNRNSEAIVNRVRAYHNAGMVMIMQEKFKQAVAYADSAMSVSHGRMPAATLSANFAIRSAVYTGLKQFTLAKQYGDSTLHYAFISKHPETILSGHQAQYEVNKLSGDYKAALQALENKIGLKDSIDNIERTAKVRSLELKYNKAKDEKTIHELAQQQEISTLNIRFLIAALIGVGLVGVVLFVLYRQKALKHKQIDNTGNRATLKPCTHESPFLF